MGLASAQTVNLPFIVNVCRSIAQQDMKNGCLLAQYYYIYSADEKIKIDEFCALLTDDEKAGGAFKLPLKKKKNKFFFFFFYCLGCVFFKKK